MRNERFEDCNEMQLISSDFLTLFVYATPCSVEFCTKTLSQKVRSAPICETNAEHVAEIFRLHAREKMKFDLFQELVA